MEFWMKLVLVHRNVLECFWPMLLCNCSLAMTPDVGTRKFWQAFIKTLKHGCTVREEFLICIAWDWAKFGKAQNKLKDSKQRYASTASYSRVIYDLVWLIGEAILWVSIIRASWSHAEAICTPSEYMTAEYVSFPVLAGKEFSEDGWFRRVARCNWRPVDLCNPHNVAYLDDYIQGLMIIPKASTKLHSNQYHSQQMK